MKISVITPLHKLDLGIIKDLIRSLDNQTEKDFEWVVLLNGEARNIYVNTELLKLLDSVPYCKYDRADPSLDGNVGALKKTLCSRMATGKYLVELDWDDMLTKDCLEKVALAFEYPDVDFVYSNGAQFRITPEGIVSDTYSSVYGWESRPFYSEDLGTNVNELIAFPPSPQYSRRIEWAPNHVRAWRREAYIALGGHNEKIQLGDDHELVCRFYVEYGCKGFYHIDECLYLYRVHDNTCNSRNEEVQFQVADNYIKYSEKMYMKWADDAYLMCLDLGARFNKQDGYFSVDLQDADIIMDLEQHWSVLPDSSVGVLRAYHVLEHLSDPIHFFNEAYRVLAPGGFLLIEVPSANGPLAFADPTHVKFYVPESFDYYTKKQKADYIRPQFKGKFQMSRINEFEWALRHKIISAHMIALKGWYDKKHCGVREI